MPNRFGSGMFVEVSLECSTLSVILFCCVRRACQTLPYYVFVMHCTINADVSFTLSRIGPDGLRPHVLVKQLRATGLQHAMTSGIASEQCRGSSRTCIILERWILFGELLADCARDLSEGISIASQLRHTQNELAASFLKA